MLKRYHQKSVTSQEPFKSNLAYFIPVITEKIKIRKWKVN